MFQYDSTAEYQRPAWQQEAYKDKLDQLGSNSVMIYAGKDPEDVEKKHLGYIMRVSHMGKTREFYFENADRFRQFMAKRNIMININEAYTMVDTEFTWSYSPAFAADFGLENDCKEILTTLPIGAR